MKQGKFNLLACQAELPARSNTLMDGWMHGRLNERDAQQQQLQAEMAKRCMVRYWAVRLPHPADQAGPAQAQANSIQPTANNGQTRASFHVHVSSIRFECK